MIAYKYKLYRTKQTKHLDAMLREASWIWNHALALQKRYYRMYHGYIDVVRMQKKWVRWYKTENSRLNSNTIQEILQRLDMTFIRFFRHIQTRPPKFKKAHSFSSIILRGGGFKLNENVLTLNKINKRFKFSLSRPYEGLGKIKRVALKRNKIGEYFVVITIDAESKPIGKSHNGASVGIDFGLKTYMTLSDGRRIKSPRFLKQGMNAKKNADRKVSRCEEGSNNRLRARHSKNRVEERITNRRDDWQWKLANELCRKYDVICIEDLHLKSMSKMWGRKMQDLSHGKMVLKLQYLAPRYGVKVKKVSRKFPSSKLCDCGYVYKELTLHDREWTCPMCGRHHDRDLHAANNILRQGIASLGSPNKTRKSVTATVQGRKYKKL